MPESKANKAAEEIDIEQDAAAEAQDALAHKSAALSPLENRQAAARWLASVKDKTPEQRITAVLEAVWNIPDNADLDRQMALTWSESVDSLHGQNARLEAAQAAVKRSPKSSAVYDLAQDKSVELEQAMKQARKRQKRANLIGVSVGVVVLAGFVKGFILAVQSDEATNRANAAAQDAQDLANAQSWGSYGKCTEVTGNTEQNCRRAFTAEAERVDAVRQQTYSLTECLSGGHDKGDCFNAYSHQARTAEIAAERHPSIDACLSDKTVNRSDCINGFSGEAAARKLFVPAPAPSGR